MKLYTKEDDIYINIPSDLVNKINEDNILLKEYIRIYKKTSKIHNFVKR